MKDRAVAIIIRNNKLLLIHRQKPGRDYHVLPGGHLKPGETPEEACVREAKEETNLTITLKEKLCTIYNHGRLEHYFLAGKKQGEIMLGGPELKRYSPDDRYDLEWVELGRLQHINLKPTLIRQTCIDCLMQNNE